MKRFATALLIAGLSATTAHSAVLVNVSDNGTSVPTFGANDTGHTTVDARFGFNDNENFGQTFTLANAGVLESIYVAYNAFLDDSSVAVDIVVNGDTVASNVLLDGSLFSGAGSDAATPIYWMQFQFTGDEIAMNAGLNSFSINGVAGSEVSPNATFAFAPMFQNNFGTYAGGSGTGTFYNVGSNQVDDDLGFAVTLVPEPGSLALLGLGGLLIARRRRG